MDRQGLDRRWAHGLKLNLQQIGRLKRGPGLAITRKAARTAPSDAHVSGCTLCAEQAAAHATAHAHATAWLATLLLSYHVLAVLLSVAGACRDKPPLIYDGRCTFQNQGKRRKQPSQLTDTHTHTHATTRVRASLCAMHHVADAACRCAWSSGSRRRQLLHMCLARVALCQFWRASDLLSCVHRLTHDVFCRRRMPHRGRH